MTKEPKAPGAAAVILFHQVDRDDDLSHPHEDVYFRVKVLTEEGRKFANIEIPYWKSEVRISNLHARTIKPDGAIVGFAGKPLEQTIIKARGIKYLAKIFTLSDVTVGSIIEYFYTVEFPSLYVFDSHWILREDLFTKDAKFTLKPAKSPLFHLRMLWRLPEGVEPKVTEKHEVHLEVQDIPLFQVEDFMPPENELKQRVDFIYTNSNGSDPDKYWKQFGKESYKLLEAFMAGSETLNQAAAQIVSQDDSKETKLKKIYARVQALRNLSYEEERTLQEQHREGEEWPKNVGEVWELHRGSGVQLTWLFLALARAAGLEAYGVWVSNRSNYFFDFHTMQSDRLSTNVVLAKVEGKDMYFDPGSKFVPFGMLPWPETGVSGYRLDKDGGGWITTTLPDSSQSWIERKATLKLTATGDLEGNLRVTFAGLEGSRLRVDERFGDEVARRKFLEDEVREWIPNVSEVELVTQPDWQSSSPEMLADFALKLRGWASATGNRAFLPVGLFGAAEGHWFGYTGRTQPIYFSFPFQRRDDVSIELPAGWRVESMPTPQSSDGSFIFYGSDAENEEGVLRLRRTLAVNKIRIDAYYYSTVRDLFRSMRSGDEQQVVLQPSSVGANQ